MRWGFYNFKIKGGIKNMKPSIENIQYLDQLKEVGINKETSILTCTLSLYGLRPDRDIDVIVSSDHFNLIMETYSEIKLNVGLSGQSFIQYKNLDIFTRLAPFFGYDQMGLIELISSGYTEGHKGYNFIILPVVISWKAALGRRKDFRDIELIAGFLK